VWRGAKLEMGRGKRKKQVPRYARNDNSQTVRSAVRQVWLGWKAGWVGEPDLHRSENRPLHAERIRRSWEARKCVAMGPVVRLGPFEFSQGKRGELQRRVGVGAMAEWAGVEVGDYWDARVAGRGWPQGRRYVGERAGSGGCNCR
jgi:hypothetical protein